METVIDEFIHYDLDDYIRAYKGRKIIIFGAGKYGKYIISKLSTSNICVYGICDNNMSSLCHIDDKYASIDLQAISEVNKYDWVISVSDHIAKLSIEDQLKNIGVSSDNIYIPVTCRNEPYFDKYMLEQPRFAKAVVRRQWIYNAPIRRQKILDFLNSNKLQKIAILEDEYYFQEIEDIIISGKLEIVGHSSELSHNLCAEADALIILPITNYDELEDDAMDFFYGPIISTWELIR